MSQREKLIGVALFIVFALWGKTTLFKPPKKSDPPLPTVQSKTLPGLDKTTKVKEAELSLEDVLRRLTVQMSDPKTAFVNDPFQRPNLKKKRQSAVLEYSDLVLMGIIWEAQEPMALINDEILEVGDTIAGFRVETIRPAEVVVSRGLEKHTLSLSTAPVGD